MRHFDCSGYTHPGLRDRGTFLETHIPRTANPGELLQSDIAQRADPKAERRQKGAGGKEGTARRVIEFNVLSAGVR